MPPCLQSECAPRRLQHLCASSVEARVGCNPRGQFYHPPSRECTHRSLPPPSPWLCTHAACAMAELQAGPPLPEHVQCMLSRTQSSRCRVRAVAARCVHPSRALRRVCMEGARGGEGLTAPCSRIANAGCRIGGSGYIPASPYPPLTRGSSHAHTVRMLAAKRQPENRREGAQREAQTPWRHRTVSLRGAIAQRRLNMSSSRGRWWRCSG